MRIALLAHRLARRHPTGVDRYARVLLHGLAARSDLSCMVAAPAERSEPTWLPPGVDLRRIPGPRKLVQLSWLVLQRPHVDRVLAGAEIVHVALPTFPVPSRLPIVYTIHDLLPLTHPEWYGRIQRWGFERAVQDAAANAAAVMVDSRATAEAASKLLDVEPTRMRIVPLAIDPRFAVAVDPADAARAAATVGVPPGAFALYVGQINPRKNVSVLVRAMAHTTAPVQLVVAGGDGPGAGAVRAEVERLGLRDRVHFAGYVPDEILPALLAAARVLVHPSRAEGFGMTPLEAMAVGTPAIVADPSALPDSVAAAVTQADPDSPDEWAAAIDAFADEDARVTASERGVGAARLFTRDRLVAETIEVYRSALERRPVG